MHRKTCSIAVTTFLALVLLTTSLSAQGLRIGSYNLNGKPNNATDQADLEAILGEISTTVAINTAQQMDVMTFQSGPADVADYALIEAAFENVYGGNFSIIYTDLDSENGRTGIVYNDDRFNLISSEQFGDTFAYNHFQLEAVLAPPGGTPDDEIKVVSVHFNEGDDALAISRRETQAQEYWFKYYPNMENSILTGTFGLTGSQEVAYMQYLHSFYQWDAMVLDEYWDAAVWNLHRSFIPFHGAETSGIDGGMSTRPDLHFIARQLGDYLAMEYVKGSLTTVGNNGTHDLSGSVGSGTGASAVQGNLINFSDHLPVFTDYVFGQTDPEWNEFYYFECSDSTIVNPAGPSTGKAFFNVEGSDNLQYSGFGVVDFDMTNAIGDKDTIYDLREQLRLTLRQSNASFTVDGPFSVYLASPAAAAIPIDASVTYQIGENGLDCMPTVLSTGAKWLATHPGVFYDVNGNLLSNGHAAWITVFGPEIQTEILAAIQNNTTVRLLIVPDHPQTAATFAGVSNTAWNGPRLTVVSQMRTVFGPAALVMLEGDIRRGNMASLQESDNNKMLLGTNDKIVAEIIGDSRVNSPQTQMLLRFEASVRSALPVEQTVELYNYEDEIWEVVDQRTSRTLADLVVTIEMTGVLRRFVNSPDGQVKARVTFTKLGFSRGINAFIDHFEWEIE